MTVEELKAVLDEMPNECEILVQDDDSHYGIEAITFEKTYKKDGVVETVIIIGDCVYR